MSSFFSELGKKLVERWVILLVLPGLLLIAVTVAGVTLGSAERWIGRGWSRRPTLGRGPSVLAPRWPRA